MHNHVLCSQFGEFTCTFAGLKICHTKDLVVYVVSFILDGNKLILKEKISDPLLVSPNDLVMINEIQFYITNDK